MASTESQTPGGAPALGKEGDACSECGKPLAVDQRYCLNCGRRRAGPRVAFEQYFGAESSANGVARAPATSRQWNPLAAAALIALLGIMLLVGVLIGKDENDEQAPAPTAPAAQSAAPATTGEPDRPAAGHRLGEAAMIGKLKERLPKARPKTEVTEDAKSEAKTKTEARPAPSGSRPGLFDTFRLGWEPPRKLAGGKAMATGSTVRARGGGSSVGVAAGDGALGHPVKEPQLLKQRDELARRFAELQWDLGGIAYEMSSRKQFKPEVLDKQVVKLSEVDSKLGQVERLLRLDQEGAAGTCPACGSLQARGAVFCWQCGKQLTTEKKPTETKQPEGKSEPAAKPESK
jgi:hypothetical protein